MKYQVNKEKLFEFLSHRPAMVKIVSDLTEDFAAECMSEIDSSTSAKEIFERLPLNLKTYKVCVALINACSVEPGTIPADVLKQLTQEDRKKLLTGNGGRSIVELPDATYDDWMFAIKSGFKNLGAIPSGFMNQEIFLCYLSQSNRYTSFGYGPVDGVDLKAATFWDKDFALKAVSVCPDIIYVVPDQFLTQEVIEQGRNIDLSRLNISNILWTQDLADRMFAGNPNNVTRIPKQFVTDDMIMRIAENYGYIFIALKRFEYPFLVKHLAHNYLRDELRAEVAKYDYDTLLLDVLKEGGVKVLDGIPHPLYWINVIKAYPQALGKVPKDLQTTEIIDAFFSSATAQDMDAIAASINLTKIRPQHAPFMLECQNTILIEVRNKYLKGNETAVEGGHMIEINMSPAEYAKIKYLL